ncbi:MAG: DUF362 domain-containing protein, partial [Candidatus Eisenbacteria bacterium]|nr:DUF362 domain-containing protein [Candidatus Eisenbacteria bacterium]
LGWLVFRTGTKPSRVVYPCQQAAMGTASLAFGAPLVAALLLGRRRAGEWLRSPLALSALLLGVTMFLAGDAYFTRAGQYAGPMGNPPLDYRAQVFHVDQCPQDPAVDRLVGLDNLLVTMARQGLKLYRSSSESALAGPDGVVAADDVVLIKINYQWAERGGTNTDLLRGLIRRIVDHPDGFTGEIVVCENAQFASTSGFDRITNNAQDHGLSPHDVVLYFQGLGLRVSHFDWTPMRYTSVAEYSEGDLQDGYVVLPYDGEVLGRPSYPKFRTSAGTYISVKDGIWDPGSSSYSREHLRFINLPILKSHHAVYGATVSVKHYMGVVTRELSTDSHYAIRTGILGAVMGEIGLADLNILDAIWINANPNTGPGTTYAGATRRDELVASLDPVALDMWSVKNILIPAFIANGFSPPWPTPSADPDDPSSMFRTYLDNSMYQLLDAGYTVTNDLTRIDESFGQGFGGDFDRDGAVDESDLSQFDDCFTGSDGGPIGPGCGPADFDLDDDVDCVDWDYFQAVWTGAGEPTPPPDCATTDAPEAPGPTETPLHTRVQPNPMTDAATIVYSLARPSTVTLTIYDVNGRSVRTWSEPNRSAGPHDVVWDGRSDAGDPVAAGIYSYVLRAGDAKSSGKIVVR